MKAVRGCEGGLVRHVPIQRCSWQFTEGRTPFRLWTAALFPFQSPALSGALPAAVPITPPTTHSPPPQPPHSGAAVSGTSSGKPHPQDPQTRVVRWLGPGFAHHVSGCALPCVSDIVARPGPCARGQCLRVSAETPPAALRMAALPGQDHELTSLCVRERERERERVCVCVCVSE